MLVSVITAVYNGELYLKEAIESILSQTYSNLEYIIINDGSTDGTAQILNSINDYRLKVIHLDNNQGAASCLNLGIDHSRGELIAIQDADDVSMHNRIEEQVNFLLNNTQYIGVGSHIRSIQGIDPVSFDRLQEEERASNFFKSADQIYDHRFTGCGLVHGSVMYYKDIFYKVGKYNQFFKIAYDYDLWLRMFEVGKIGMIQNALYQWRVNPRSLSREKRVDTNNEVFRASTLAIQRHYFIKNTYPTLGVCASPGVYKNFQQQVAPYLNINLRYYSLSTKNTKDLYGDYYKNIINGLIILYNYSNSGEKIYHNLTFRGFEPNNTIFKIWDAIS